ncbi:hypothetical protein V8F20_005149 [Naviculisporaceae sp. PSN 640]
MGTLDTTRTFTLKSNQTGSDYLLSTTRNGSAAIMSPARQVSESSQWFATVTELKAYYRLHTVFKGRAYALDVVNTNGENSTRLYLSKTNKKVPGQYWRFDEWEYGPGYRLSNNLTGLDMHLDVRPDTLEPFLAPGDRPGQHWTLWSSAMPGTSPSRESASSGSHAVSGRGIAGIVIGAISALGLTMLAALRMLRMRKRKNRKPGHLEAKQAALADSSNSGADPSPVPESAISGFTWSTAGSQPQELAGDPDAVSPLSPFSASLVGKNWASGGNAPPVFELPSPLAELPDQPIKRNVK